MLSVTWRIGSGGWRNRRIVRQAGEEKRGGLTKDILRQLSSGFYSYKVEADVTLLGG